MQKTKEEILKRKVSFEMGLISLLSVSLFFMLQIVSAEAYGNAEYALTVNGGTGSGSYAQGANVAISANQAVSGKVFYKWNGDVEYVANPTAAATTVAMPAKAVTLTAVYKDAPGISSARLKITLNGRTVNAKAGSAGVVIQEMRLKNNLNKSAVVKVNSFEMKSSAADGSISSVANFSTLYLYLDNKQIGKASFEGNKAVFDSIVAVSAGKSSSLVLRADVSANAVAQSVNITKMNYEETVSSGGVSTTTLTVLNGNYSTVNIKANSTAHALTVKNGTGSGSYAEGTKVTITANAASSGKVFDKWTGDTKYVADPAAITSAVTMPNKPVTLTAAYKSLSLAQSLKATVTSQNTTVKKGAKDIILMEADLANTGTETLSVSGLGIMADYGANSISNVKLFIDGKDMGSPSTTKVYEAIYKSLPLQIEAGKTAKLVLRGDVSSNIKLKGLGFRLDSCPNVFTVKGTTTGKKAKLSISGKSYLYFTGK